MINLTDYLDPVSIEKPLWSHIAEPSTLAHNLSISTASKPLNNISGFKLAIIGVPDDRRSPNKGSSQGPDKIRESLYTLARLPGKNKIADLGNLKQGPRFEDSLAALYDVVNHLLKEECQVLILGGSSAVMSALDKVLSENLESYNWSNADSRIDFVAEKDEPDSFNYLSEILYNSKSGLRRYTGIGYQTYINDQQAINRLRKLNHDLVRIGEARSEISETEPVFRDSELITFDISSVRQSDAPGTFAPSPNGFYTEEICLLARYAGLSDRLKIFGIFEVNPILDSRNQTSALAAQLLWFMLEGVVQRTPEAGLIGNDRNGRFVQYHVSIDDLEEELLFVKSTVTGRWWMEIKATKGKPWYLACSHKDYLKANEGEIPGRWLRAVSGK
ncbi:MAG: formimidoylglutamase [Marinilabiliaceae bacterium]|jgi:arginase family enzyme|nr:formimidoylglutamase [Marinilabiliaceae bacterium]